MITGFFYDNEALCKELQFLLNCQPFILFYQRDRI